jgi:hypothetical protein
VSQTLISYEALASSRSAGFATVVLSLPASVTNGPAQTGKGWGLRGALDFAGSAAVGAGIRPSQRTPVSVSPLYTFEHTDGPAPADATALGTSVMLQMLTRL